MKYLIIIILLVFSVFSKAQSTQLTKEEKIYGLSLIWQEVNYNYAYMQDYKLDWDSLYIENIPKVLAAKNLTEYYAILSGIMNSFHEAHTAVELPEEVQQMYGSIPIELVYIKGNYHVTGFAPEYKDKISIGSILISINNYDAESYYTKFVFPNNNLAAHSAKRYLSKSKFFAGKLSEDLSAIFLNPNGKTISLKLNRIPKDSNEIKLIEAPSM